VSFLLENPWLLALVIFLARVVDVSLGTVRTILVFRGRAMLAAGIGFVELLIWVAAAGQVLQNLDRWYLAVSYAAGFATGNIVGIWLERRLAVGHELVRAISDNPSIRLATALRDGGYSVISLPGSGAQDQSIEVLLIVERRRRVADLLDSIHTADPEAVVTLSDTRHPSRRTPNAFARSLGILRRALGAKRR
jgi:uncharacterized protein YebE (UPF0316 family)